ncbi:peroxiredoxin-like family protein [Micromonospora sp. SL1-18]|uniref:peroxiredoxin-like family protein n=1 Tax=Micromonospora sp. SL1-18 TaxID=3399128 RepID=UPI003A4E6735
MPQLSAGHTIAPRVLTTIRSEAVPIPDPERLVHLQFRRYAGCPVCNLHLRSVARRHADIRAAGIHEVAVFHSPAEDMLPHQADLPFAVVADPQRLLYAEFGVEASRRAVTDPRAWTTPLKPRVYPMVLRGLRNGGSPGPRHGETVLGLPADFLIDPAGRVVAVRYGRHANDQWSVDELIELALPAVGS